MNRRHLLIPLVLLLFNIPVLAVELHEDKLGDSLIRIARPDNWTGDVLLLAHGYRPTEADMSAYFSLDGHFYKSMLERGWLVAATSYRRNGFILDDAVEDVEFLRQEVERRYQPKGLTLVSGNSMGGGVATMIAESGNANYDGALALGAYLAGNSPTYQAKIPLLFVSNRSELGGPTEYVSKSSRAPIVPAVWSIDRDGHVNIGHEEWLVAIDGLLEFIRTGEIENGKDNTIKSLVTSKAAFTADGALTKVTGINSSFGNLETEFTSEDLDAIDVKRGDSFWVSCNEKTYKVFYGTTYSDVPQGDWVAFITAEATLRIARNYDSAAQTLGCKVGDNIMITR
jgi:pimeloyl-ACP methyl ester carboxylesterase